MRSLSQFLTQELEGCNFTKKWYKYWSPVHITTFRIHLLAVCRPWQDPSDMIVVDNWRFVTLIVVPAWVNFCSPSSRKSGCAEECVLGEFAVTLVQIFFFFFTVTSHTTEWDSSGLRLCCSQDFTSYGAKREKKKVKSVTSFSMNVIALQGNVMFIFDLKVILLRV